MMAKKYLLIIAFLFLISFSIGGIRHNTYDNILETHVNIITGSDKIENGRLSLWIPELGIYQTKSIDAAKNSATGTFIYAETGIKEAQIAKISFEAEGKKRTRWLWIW